MNIRENVSINYDNAEFSVATGTTNYDVKSNQASTFGGATSDVGTIANYVAIRTDKTISIKMNNTSNSSITISSFDSPFVINGAIEVGNIYITNNSGSTANIKLLLAKPI